MSSERTFLRHFFHVCKTLHELPFLLYTRRHRFGRTALTFHIHASLRRPPTSSSVSTFRRNASLTTEGSASQVHPAPQLPRTQRI
ncbi:hypothetical protein FIBSPDRAFT_879924 [Athelia psychrophila]|uniref:Uncharacterized protein n=1 Tax=Athelia psychrophila TaxID=1759441 RepID=A0A167TGH9_9AGAM|nr:hypothetical protein FIBSPDRAFT_879924 [Fibularhizoctonia sp. CBS 109695]